MPNKLVLNSLPVSNAPVGSYERQLNVKLNETLDRMRQRINGLITNPSLPVYADNAAAVAGGMVEGEFYRTSTGSVMVVY